MDWGRGEFKILLIVSFALIIFGLNAAWAWLTP